MNTNNIVLWEIQLNNADWDCVKTLTTWNIVRIRKSHLCSDKLDVQETDMFITHRSKELENSSLCCRLEKGRYSRA